MPDLAITLLGGIELWRDGRRRTLPSSRKTRSLLGYLALTSRPARRERLCELLWELPDDPRASLRWSLTKLRPLLNDPDHERLCADRERVWFEGEAASIDMLDLEAAIDRGDVTLDAAIAACRALEPVLLDGAEVDGQEEFNLWLASERHHAERLRARYAAFVARHAYADPEIAGLHAQLWRSLDPYDPDAANAEIAALRRAGGDDRGLVATIAGQMREAGIDWQAPAHASRPRPSAPTSRESSPRRIVAQQDIGFCKTRDGTTIAYATVGEGPPLVKAANWMSHLELDWETSWNPVFRQIARDHRFIRYDERGNGLSNWDVADISFAAFVEDLETVVDQLGLDSFPLLGISQGAGVSIEYAVRHPEKVSHLILFGGYAAGWRIDADAQTIAEREAIMTLTRTGWGQDNPAYQHMFSATFMPGASAEILAWFDEFQRRTTNPENAVRFLSAFGDIDVRHRLGEIACPTLVLHSRHDRRIPWLTGRGIAAEIPGARFVTLESENHLLIKGEPAVDQFTAELRNFLAA